MNSPSPLQGLEPSTNCIVMPAKSSTKKQNRNSKRQLVVVKSEREAPNAFGSMVPRTSFTSLTPRRGSASFRGCDYFGSIASATTATVTSLSTGINARNAALFPRLASLASIFLKFSFRKLSFVLLGQSPSTQRGNIGFMSIVNDLPASAETGVTTDARVKNTEDCLVIKGWENGRHVVKTDASGLKWYNTDQNDTGAVSYIGSVWYSIPATVAAGDLTWDVYVEYEIDLDEAVSPLITA